MHNSGAGHGFLILMLECLKMFHSIMQITIDVKTSRTVISPFFHNVEKWPNIL